MNTKIKNILFSLLILWQLYFWFEFVPITDIDPYSDLAPLLYYLFGIPAALLGIALSVMVIKRRLEVKKWEKIMAWVLLVVSICTAIPPLFKIVRYIFYPLAIWLG